MSFSTTEESLRSLFSQFGEVESVTVMTDKFTGQSKGFGFVEIASDDDALKAIGSLNGKDFEGRRIRVNEAQERKSRFTGRRERTDDSEQY